MSQFLDRLLGVGERALENLADRATLGKDAATRLRLADEAEFYGRLNGSGPNDYEGYRRDAAAGDPYFRNPFRMEGATGLGVLIVGTVAVVVLFVAFKR